MERPNDRIHWLPQDEYTKATTQLRTNIAGALFDLRLYGQGEIVDQAIVEIMKLAEDFGLRVRGIDKPVSLEQVRRELYYGVGK